MLQVSAQVMQRKRTYIPDPASVYRYSVTESRDRAISHGAYLARGTPVGTSGSLPAAPAYDKWVMAAE